MDFKLYQYQEIEVIKKFIQNKKDDFLLNEYQFCYYTIVADLIGYVYLEKVKLKEKYDNIDKIKDKLILIKNYNSRFEKNLIEFSNITSLQIEFCNEFIIKFDDYLIYYDCSKEIIKTKINEIYEYLDKCKTNSVNYLILLLIKKISLFDDKFSVFYYEVDELINVSKNEKSSPSNKSSQTSNIHKKNNLTKPLLKIILGKNIGGAVSNLLDLKNDLKNSKYKNI